MRKALQLLNTLTVVTIIALACASQAATLDVLYQAPNVSILVGGYDRLPNGTLAEPTAVTGEFFGGGGALGTNYEVLEWVNAAAPWSSANEWTYTGTVSGGTYNADVIAGDVPSPDMPNSLIETPPYTTSTPDATSDALWLETGDVATATTTVPSNLVAFFLKADDNDGIADFYVDGVLIATIDLYFDENEGYAVNREDYDLNPEDKLIGYYLPVMILVDLRIPEELDERQYAQQDVQIATTHTLTIDAVDYSNRAVENDVEIFGAAALTPSDPITPEPSTAVLIGMTAMALLKRKK